MYVKDGFVCGGEPKDMLKIIGVKALPDKIMILTFNTGEERLFDATVLRGQVYKPLENEDIFLNPTVDHGIVTWKNGEIDCSPEYMYKNSYDYTAEIA